MDENVPGGAKRIETVAERLGDRLVDDDGRAADPEEVSEVVESTARSFEDAPVQDFVPLLVEHRAGEELRDRGLHADLSAGPKDPSGPQDGWSADDRADEPHADTAADLPQPPR